MKAHDVAKILMAMPEDCEVELNAYGSIHYEVNRIEYSVQTRSVWIYYENVDRAIEVPQQDIPQEEPRG